MNNTGIILTLAYPDTIVMLSKEWFSPYLRFIGMGRKNYLRAGHGALVLINKETGVLEYHDFGRYITPEPYGRVRGSDTDHELDLPLKAVIKNGTISNLDTILKFLGTHPKLTHGEGKLIASICKNIDYHKARIYITRMQKKHFIRYAAFINNASNCARFVTDTLIASVTNSEIKKKLEKSNWFTPSTIGNVLLANTEDAVFEVSETGILSEFKGSRKSENLRCFFDRIKEHETSHIGSLEPKTVDGLHLKAQWLSGIGTGSWFELHYIGKKDEYQFRKISPYGNIDCDGIYEVDSETFDISMDYEFIHYSNCQFFYIRQNNETYRFEFQKNYMTS